MQRKGEVIGFELEQCIGLEILVASGWIALLLLGTLLADARLR